jgi:cyanate lyase
LTIDIFKIENHNRGGTMTAREQLTEKILAAKRRLELKWSTIAPALGSGSAVMYTAALLGQFPLTAEEAQKAVAVFDLDDADAALLTEPPMRGAGTVMPPTDPLIYRFYELVQNYGTTWKVLIEEEFGDGIMSAIDFNMSIARERDPKGDRVKIEMSGKFLPYKRY